jgi:hypothetical protein
MNECTAVGIIPQLKHNPSWPLHYYLCRHIDFVQPVTPPPDERRENDDERDPATQCCWPDCQRPVLTCGSWICRSQQSCRAALEERKIGCKRKGRAWILRCSTSRIAKPDALERA